MRVPGFLTRNLRLKTLALALASVMWAGVAYANNPPDTRTVTVAVPQAAADLSPWVLVQAVAPVSVRVSGTRQHLAAFDSGDLVVSVNYKAITQAGIQNLPVSVVNNDRDVVLDGTPAPITVNVDRHGSRTVDVTVDIIQPPPEGYVVISSATAPSTVTLLGPQHQLAGVEARVTLNLSSQRSNYQANKPVALVDSSTRQQVSTFGVTIAGQQTQEVLVTVQVAASLTSRSSAVIPKTGAPSPGHYLAAETVSPASVVLNGPQDLLNTANSVSTSLISLTGVTGTVSFTVRVTPAAGVTASPVSVTVTVTVDAIPQPPPTATPTPTPTPTPSPLVPT